MFFNTNQKRVIFIIILCLFIIISGFCFFSYITFGSTNPIITGIGLLKIHFTDIEYVVIKKSPQIIITKQNDSLNRLVEYMNSQGFMMIDRGGSIIFFENDTFEKQLVKININRYYSRWVWN
jgi:hypothetical protein